MAAITFLGLSATPLPYSKDTMRLPQLVSDSYVPFGLLAYPPHFVDAVLRILVSRRSLQ